MKIRTKITLWVGVLLFLIILLTGLGVGYVNMIKKNTDNILASNHLSVQYAQKMLDALNISFHDEQAIRDFRGYLEKQKSKISEIDIAIPVRQIEQDFEALILEPDNKDFDKHIRKDVAKIMQINLEAIVAKSNLASQTAKTANVQITLFGIICFIVACILFFRLPRSVAEPVAKLIEGTKQITKENYSYRISIQGDDEFKNLADSFNDMTSKLEEYAGIHVSKLLIEKKRIETIINSIYDPIIILDEYDTILFINREALKIADLKMEEVIRSNIHDLAQSNIFFQTVLRGIFPSHSNKSEKRELKLKIEGEENYFDAKYLDLTIDPQANNTKKKIGTIILLQNITSYKKLDIAKTNFIASMSHNFKTPISSSQIGLHLLRKDQTGQLSGEQQQLIDSIEEDIQKLLAITGDLLKISEVESENIQLKITSIDLRKIVEYAINTIQRQADRKLICLEVNLPDEIPKIKGDAEKIAWVLINLISNAIRYSDENSTVRIRIKNKKNHIHLFVEDQGQGIPLEYQERIFARYFRAPGTNEKGTGLGLAIGKEFMEAQEGTIKVESKLGEGSTFTMILKKDAKRSFTDE